MDTVSSALLARSSGNVPPWQIPNCALSRNETSEAKGPGIFSLVSRKRSRHLLAHRAVSSQRTIDDRPEWRAAPDIRPGPSRCRSPGSHWISTARSGVSTCVLPSRCELNSDAALIYLPPVRQAEYLIAAAIGEDRFVPADELVEAASTGDQLITRPQHQVIGVAEDDLRADLLKVLCCQRFNNTLRADRHERRRLDHAVRRREDPSPRTAICMSQREQKIPGPFIIAE